MFSWFKAMSLGRKILLGLVSFAVIGAAASAISPPQKSAPIVPMKSPVIKAPVSETKTVTDTKPVAYQVSSQNDSSLASGTSKLITTGVDGVETIIYRVTYSNGVEINREKISDEVTTQPVNQVTAIGTYVAPKPSCDPNYSGGCVPIASDVDCGGGSGNGPAYFYGTATVVGSDIYGLDRDGDGIACE